MRLGAASVAILDGGETVAEHRRLRGRKGQYSTDPAHMPPEHLVNLPRFRLHPYAAVLAAPSICLASNSAGLRLPSAEWILTLL